MPVLWMGRGSICADSAGLWACLRCAYIVQYDHKLYKKPQAWFVGISLVWLIINKHHDNYESE